MSDNSLANDLAEKIVVKLKEDGALDLTDTKAFRDFTSLLHEAITKNEVELTNYIGTLGSLRDDLDNLKEQDKNTLESIKNQNANISNEIKNIVQYVADYVANSNNANTNTQTQAKQPSKKPTTNTVAPPTANVEEKAKEELEKKEAKASDDKIKETLDSVNKRSLKILKAINEFTKDTKKDTKQTEQTIKHEVKQSERKTNLKHRFQINKTERKLKHTIKSRFSKWWSRIKKLMFIASIFFFGSFLKKVLSGVKEMTEPIWRPFVTWFEGEFPKITKYISDIADSVKTIADFVKPIVDYFAEEEKNKEVDVASGELTTDANGNVKATNVTDAQIEQAVSAKSTQDYVAEGGTLAVGTAATIKAGMATGPIGAIAAAGITSSILGYEDMMNAYGNATAIKAKYQEQEDDLLKRKETTTDPVELQAIETALKLLAYNRARVDYEAGNHQLMTSSRAAGITMGQAFKSRQVDKAKKEYEEAEKLLKDMQAFPNQYDNNGMLTTEGYMRKASLFSNTLTSKLEENQGQVLNVVENTSMHTTEINIVTDSKKPFE